MCFCKLYFHPYLKSMILNISCDEVYSAYCNRKGAFDLVGTIFMWQVHTWETKYFHLQYIYLHKQRILNFIFNIAVDPCM